MAEQPVPDFSYDPSAVEFAVSKRAFFQAHPDASFEYIATSILVLDTETTPEPRTLLLQRAASDTNPNKWEPPGGACDDDDKTILHGAARELWEETGFQADQISGPIGAPHFFTRSNGGKVCRFNFLVQVSPRCGPSSAVKLDPKEHQNFVWATEAEVKVGRADGIDLEFVREEVKRTALLAFEQPR